MAPISFLLSFPSDDKWLEKGAMNLLIFPPILRGWILRGIIIGSEEAREQTPEAKS
jgi:hypothetical protein